MNHKHHSKKETLCKHCGKQTNFVVTAMNGNIIFLCKSCQKLKHNPYTCQARLKRKRKGKVPCCRCKAHKNCELQHTGVSVMRLDMRPGEAHSEVIGFSSAFYKPLKREKTKGTPVATPTFIDLKWSLWDRLKSWFKSFANGIKK